MSAWQSISKFNKTWMSQTFIENEWMKSDSNGTQTIITYYINEFVYSYPFKLLPTETLTLLIPTSSFSVSSIVNTYTGKCLGYYFI